MLIGQLAPKTGPGEGGGGAQRPLPPSGSPPCTPGPLLAWVRVDGQWQDTCPKAQGSHHGGPDCCLQPHPPAACYRLHQHTHIHTSCKYTPAHSHICTSTHAHSYTHRSHTHSSLCMHHVYTLGPPSSCPLGLRGAQRSKGPWAGRTLEAGQMDRLTGRL